MARRPVPLARLQQLIPFLRGLTRTEVDERRQEYGTNEIVETTTNPLWDLLRDTAKDPMLWLFAGVGVLYALIGQLTEALTLLVAILPLLGMDSYLPRRTQASTAGLKTRLATTAKVVRDDSVMTIPALDLVPGDLVVIPPGEPSPADGLVVDGTGLQVDESALTGEAYPVPKRPLGDLPRASGDPLVEEEYWVFAGGQNVPPTKLGEQGKIKGILIPPRSCALPGFTARLLPPLSARLFSSAVPTARRLLGLAGQEPPGNPGPLWAGDSSRSHDSLAVPSDTTTCVRAFSAWTILGSR